MEADLRELVGTVQDRDLRRLLDAVFDVDAPTWMRYDQVTAAIRADQPAERKQRPAPAPATAHDPNGLVLRVLAAMSSGERVAIGLHDRSEHVGRICGAPPDGLALETGTAIAIAEVGVITTPRPPAEKRDRRDRRLAACAHAFGYRGHCLTKSRGYSIRFKDLREDRERHVHEQLLAHSTDAYSASSHSSLPSSASGV
jgi:hypothetical protein